LRVTVVDNFETAQHAAVKFCTQAHVVHS